MKIKNVEGSGGTGEKTDDAGLYANKIREDTKWYG
jgi:hypothetical protein